MSVNTNANTVDFLNKKVIEIQKIIQENQTKLLKINKILHHPIFLKLLQIKEVENLGLPIIQLSVEYLFEDLCTKCWQIYYGPVCLICNEFFPGFLYTYEL